MFVIYVGVNLLIILNVDSKCYNISITSQIGLYKSRPTQFHRFGDLQSTLSHGNTDCLNRIKS